jgi:hypothetical protein
VIARKGEKNEWHFGHDSSPKHQPERECEISFWVCCRQFFIDCAVNGLLPNFTTPSIWLTQRYNRAPTALSQLNWYPSDIGNFDLMASVADFTLHLYLSYQNRENPVLDANPNRLGKMGFVDLSIQSLEKDIDHHARLSSGILQQAKHLFENDLPGIKQWIQHPLECLEVVKADIEEERRQKDAHVKEERENKEKAIREKAEEQARRAQIAKKIAFEAGIRTLQAEREDRLSHDEMDKDKLAAILRYPALFKAIEKDKRGSRVNAAATLMFLLNRQRKIATESQWPPEQDLIALYRQYRSGAKI